MVLLVTPALIDKLDSNNTFIPRALERFFSWGYDGGQVDVLAAVVDRIPAPSGKELDRLGSNTTPDHGSEGISMAIVESSKAMPDLWSAHAQEATSRDKQSPDGRYSLSLVLKPSDSVLEHGTGGKGFVPYLVHRLQLPLASTLFQTGRTSTLFAESWKATFIRKGFREWTRERRVHLEHQELHLPAPYRRSVTTIDLQGLETLTPPRVVAESMGNIIRKLKFGDDTGGTVTASQELEGQIMAQEKLDNGLVYHSEIWAQVIPREIWPSHPTKPLSYSDGIEHGHRLHRVLSGGGGWGNKQGLIALDPNSSFFPASNDLSLDFGDKLDYDGDQRQVLGEVVRPGDIVSFLSFSKPSIATKRVFSSFEGDETPLDIRTRMQFLFGNAMPVVDENVTLPAHFKQPGVQPRYLLFHNLFGALSTTGASVSVDLIPSPHRADTGAQRTGRIVESKLPPLAVVHSTHEAYAKIWVKRVGERNDDQNSSASSEFKIQEKNANSSTCCDIG